MPPSERFLASLRNVGKLESEGFFSLDGRKAQEKMREFALVDAHEYVLKFVQAAVAGAATQIEVKAEPRSVSVLAHGWEVGANIFEDLFAGLFLSQARGETQAWRHLAIGVNAALALQPRSVEIRSAGRVIVVESAERVAVRDAPDAPRGGTRIDVLQRVSWRMAGRAISALGRGVPEGRLVAERAVWSRVPVILNGRPVSLADWTQTFRSRVNEAPNRLDVQHGVWVPLKTPSAAARVRFVQHGVTICEHPLESVPVQAVVHGDELLTNASGSDVVIDARYKARVADVSRIGEVLVTSLATAPSAADSAAWWRDTRPYLLTLVAKGLIESSRTVHVFIPAALRAAPLFKDVVGSPVSLDVILDARKEGRVVYPCRTEMRLSTPPSQLYVQVDGTAAHEALQKVLGAEWLAPLADRATSDRVMSWLSSRSRQLDLPARGSVLATVPIEKGDVRGTVALPAARLSGTSALVRFMIDGRDVVTKYVDLGGRGFDAVIDCPRLKPTTRFDDVVNDDVLGEVKALLTSAFEEACAQMARDWDGEVSRLEIARAYLIALLRPQGRKTAIDPAIEAFPLFDTVAGGLASIADLRADVAEFGAVAVVPESSPGTQVGGRRIVVSAQGALLTRLFGRNVQDYSRALADAREAMLKRQGPKLRPNLPDAVLAVEFSVGDVHGVIGLPAVATSLEMEKAMKKKRPPARGALNVTFLVSGTPVETRLIVEARGIDLAVGPLEAMVEAPRLTPSPAWDAVLDDASLTEALHAIEEGITVLAVRIAQRLATLRPGGRAQYLKTLTLYAAWKAKTLPSEVLSAPLIATISGKHLSLAEIIDEAAAHDDLCCVFAQPAASHDEEGRTVLLLDTEESQQLLGSVLPGVRLVDRKKALARQSGRRAFLKRPEVPSTLDGKGRRYLVRLPLVDAPAGWRGELGVLSPKPQGDAEVRVQVLREGRVLQELTVWESFPAEAVVVWDDAPATETWSGLDSGAEERRVLSVVERTVKAAIVQLLTGDVRPGSDVARLLLTYALRNANSALDLQGGRLLVARVAQAPILEDSTGAPMNLATLATDYTHHRRIRWVSTDVMGEPMDSRPVVRCDTGTLSSLTKVFKKYEDVRPLLEAAESSRHVRDRAPKVASLTLGPGPWIAHLSLNRGGLKGELGVSPTPDASVELVVDTRCVERRRLLPGVSLAGVVACDAFRASTDWTEVIMGRLQARALEREVDVLFEQVARKAVDSAEARTALFAYFLARRAELLGLKGETLPPRGAKMQRAEGTLSGATSSLLPAAAQVAIMPCADGVHRMSLQGVIDIWRSERPEMPDDIAQRFTRVADVLRGATRENAGLVYVADEPVEWPYRLLSSRDAELIEFLELFFDSRAVLHVDSKSSEAVRREQQERILRQQHRTELEKHEAAERRKRERQEQEERSNARKHREQREREDRERLRLELAEARRREAEATKVGSAERKLQDALVAGFSDVCARMAPRWRERFAGVKLVVGAGPLVTCDADGCASVAAEHPITQAVLERLPHDRGAVAALMSAVYTMVNQVEADVTDDDEVRFMEDLVDWLLEGDAP